MFLRTGRYWSRWWSQDIITGHVCGRFIERRPLLLSCLLMLCVSLGYTDETLALLCGGIAADSLGWYTTSLVRRLRIVLGSGLGRMGDVCSSMPAFADCRVFPAEQMSLMLVRKTRERKARMPYRCQPMDIKSLLARSDFCCSSAVASQNLRRATFEKRSWEDQCDWEPLLSSISAQENNAE